MIIIELTYKVDIKQVERHLAAHIEFLEQGYQQGYFIASGRKVPRTGGIILSPLTDGDKLMQIIQQDPFYYADIAEFKLTEFVVSKTHPDFVALLTQ